MYAANLPGRKVEEKQGRNPAGGAGQDAADSHGSQAGFDVVPRHAAEVWV